MNQDFVADLFCIFIMFMSGEKCLYCLNQNCIKFWRLGGFPHGFIKSVFAERKNGSFGLWTFKMENKASTKPLGSFLVKTYDAEQYVGGRFWDRVSGGDLHDQKRKRGTMWKTGGPAKAKISKSKLTKMSEAELVEMAIGMGIDASVKDAKKDTIEKLLKRLSA